MTKGSRLEQSLKNLLSSSVAKILTLFFNFFVRSLFIAYLGNTFLSINGLYANILGMLSLAELGFGSTVVFRMYRPLSEGDYEKLSVLLRLYRNAYRLIGWAVLGIGLAIVPFLHSFIKIPDGIIFPDVMLNLPGQSLHMSYFTVYYLLFLANTGVSYWFWGYKHSVLTADQKEYICTNIQTGLSVLRALIQLVLLWLVGRKNPFITFALYLWVQLAVTVAGNILIAFKVRKLYPALSVRRQQLSSLPRVEIRQIAKEVGSSALARICHIALNSTDNILISCVVGTLWIGRLSNYTLLTESVTGILCLFSAAITSSLGNYFVEKSRDEGYTLFRHIEFANSWLYGMSAVALLVLMTPFITVWLRQEDYLLSLPTVCALSINFYVAGYMNTLWIFRSSKGLFTQGWFRPLLVALINIAASVGLGYALGKVSWFGYKDWGVFGILIATFIARACVNVWYDALIVIRHGFSVSAKPFFKDNLLRLLQFACATLLLLGLRRLLPVTLDMSRTTQLMHFSLLTLLTAFVLVLFFWLINRRRSEYKFFLSLLKDRLSRLRKH